MIVPKEMDGGGERPAAFFTSPEAASHSSHSPSLLLRVLNGT